MIVSHRLMMLLVVSMALYPLALALNVLYDDWFFMEQVRWQFVMASRRTIMTVALQDYIFALPWSIVWMLNIIVADSLKNTFLATPSRVLVYILPSIAVGIAFLFTAPLLVLILCVLALILTFLFQRCGIK